MKNNKFTKTSCIVIGIGFVLMLIGLGVLCCSGLNEGVAIIGACIMCCGLLVAVPYLFWLGIKEIISASKRNGESSDVCLQRIDLAALLQRIKLACNQFLDEIEHQGLAGFLIAVLFAGVGGYLVGAVVLIVLDMLLGIDVLDYTVHLWIACAIIIFIFHYVGTSKDGRCPKCGAKHAMIKVRSTKVEEYDGTTVVTDEVRRPGKILPDKYINRTVPATVTVYLCTYKCKSCGYEENKREQTRVPK